MAKGWNRSKMRETHMPKHWKKIAKSCFFLINNRVFFMAINLNLMLVLGSGIGDGLGSNISNTPYDSWADDLSFNWVDSQGILVPFPQLQHFPKSMYTHKRERNSRKEKRMKERQRKWYKERNENYGFWTVMPFWAFVLAKAWIFRCTFDLIFDFSTFPKCEIVWFLVYQKKKIVPFLESVQMKRVISIVGRLTQNYRYLYL